MRRDRVRLRPCAAALLAAVVVLLVFPSQAVAAADTVPPRTTARLIGLRGGEGWWRKLTIEITAEDARSNIRSVDLEQPNTFRPHSAVILPSRRSVTVSYPIDAAPGIYSLRYRSADAAGNVARWTSLPLRYDANPPGPIVHATGSRGEWVNTDRWVASTVRVVADGCFDHGSGCVSSSVTSPSGQTLSPGVPFLLSGEGRHTFTSRSVDLAGNVGTWPLPFLIDLSPPVAAMAVRDGAIILAEAGAITLDADVFDPTLADGTESGGVGHVVFWMSLRKIPIDATAHSWTGYSVSGRTMGGRWSSRVGVPTGSYDVIAVAHDQAGNRTQSASVNLLVVNPCVAGWLSLPRDASQLGTPVKSYTREACIG